jgi:hypothetical protein
MRKHFFVIIVALVLTATVCVAGCTSNNTSPTPSASATRSATFVPKNIAGYRNYTNSSASIAIQYPPSWQLIEPGGGSAAPIAYFNVSGVDMSFTIVSESFSGQSVTLAGYSQDLISALQQNTTNFTYKLSNTTLAGYPAQKLVFTLVSGGIIRQGIIELTLVNNTGYALTYVAAQDVYPNYVGIAQNMMQSFNITG